MKLSIFIIFLIGMAGCTSPQAPVSTGPTIAGLSIPDTINYGVVRVGLTKDSSVIFKNTGTDTIYTTSQSFSDSVFKLEFSQNRLIIAPGASVTVIIQFIPKDTSASFLGYDTIRTANKTSILVLRGSAVPFTSLAVLSIPDTIDFGVIRAGTTKDSNIVFKNTGTDTLKITSQRFSNSSFKLSNASQSQMSIAPGASETVSVQFLPSDTSSVLGYDTIRTAYKTSIIVLRGRAVPFSSGFLIAPKEIYISLSGVIATPDTSQTYSLTFSASFDGSHSQNESYSFVTQGSDVLGTNQNGDPRITDAYATIATAAIDSNLIVRSLSVSYSYSYNQPWGNPTYTRNQGLNLHGVSLKKNGNQYAGSVASSLLPSTIDSIYYNCYGPTQGADAPDCNYPALDSVCGYRSNAILSIQIR